MTTMAAFIAVVMALTAALTWLMRRIALRHGLIDNPNSRSSHAQPTPRGGGAAIVAVVTAVLALLAWRGTIAFETFAALGVGGLTVAIVGFIDDRRQLSTRLRLAVHFAAAAWVLAWLQGLPPIQVGQRVLEFGWLGYPLGLLGIVWLLNLFNFMDGIDGLAGSETGFVAIGGVGVLSAAGLGAGLPWVGVALGAACAGFLVWNWPPAKVFLGDVGSGYLGFMVASLAILCARENPVALWVFLILAAVFVVDATFTFLRRVARREGFDVAHRTHGYQRLARRWGGHRPVTVAVVLTNLTILLPAAAYATLHPHWAAGIAMAVVAVLGITAFLVGSGSASRED